MLALQNFVLPFFDGHFPLVVDWVEQLETCVRHFPSNPPFTFILSTTRSYLINEAAEWWDAQTSLPNDFQTLRNMILARFTIGPDYARSCMTQLMANDNMGSVLNIIKRVNSLKTISAWMHRDYPLIMKALTLMDCPVVVKRLKSLSLENVHYGWRAFQEDVQNHYTLELAHQAQLCQPYIDHDGKMRFRDSAEYHARSKNLGGNCIYCVICFSTHHRTNDCSMLKDILTLDLY